MKKIILFILCFFSIAYMHAQMINVPPVRTFDLMVDFQRNDTIFRGFICNKTDSVSVRISYFFTKLTKTKWISNQHSDGTFIIAKFRKKKASEWFAENNEKWLKADFECKEKSISQWYKPNGNVIRDYHFFNIIHRKEVTPKTDKKGNIKPANSIYHRIQKGETLLDIAKKYYITEKKILELNKFKDGVMPTKGRIRVQ